MSEAASRNEYATKGRVLVVDDDASLAEIGRVLKDGGLFRFASDIDDYAGWTLVRAARCPVLAWTARDARDWTRPFPGWPGTRYEAKALEAGRRPTYLEFVRRPR